MNDRETVLMNIEKMHTTEMGVERIKKNLKLKSDDAVGYCISKILDENCVIYKKGKIFYLIYRK